MPKAIDPVPVPVPIPVSQIVSLSGSSIALKDGTSITYSAITATKATLAEKDAALLTALKPVCPPGKQIWVRHKLDEDGVTAIACIAFAQPEDKEPPDWFLSEPEKKAKILPALLGVFGLG